MPPTLEEKIISSGAKSVEWETNLLQCLTLCFKALGFQPPGGYLKEVDY